MRLLLEAVAERLWSDPPEQSCQLKAVRRRLKHVMAHIRHEHNATATGPSGLEKPDIVTPGFDEMILAEVGPLPKCGGIGGGSHSRRFLATEKRTLNGHTRGDIFHRKSPPNQII